MGYAAKVKREIARWAELGLIDAATASRLSLDVERNGASRISFGSVLAIMAAALFGAAILLFVAANWEAMPRLLRVGMLFSVILGSHLGGAILKLRGRAGFGEAVWVVAAAAFGGAIALIGQMYHLSGDEASAIFVWGAGTALAAAALRSNPLTVCAVLLGATWMTVGVMSGWDGEALPNSYLLVAAALWALSFWTESQAARHILTLSLFLFAVFFYWKDESFTGPILLVAASIGLFTFDYYRADLAGRFLGLGTGAPVHALLGFLTGMGIMQFVLAEDREFAIVSILVLSGIVAALLIAGRENTLLRWLAYAAFAFQLCFIYVVMFGSMLGTAGFFLLAGLFLAGLAWLIARLERRFAMPQPSQGGAQ